MKKVEHVVAADLVEVSFPATCKEQIDGGAIPQVGLTRFLFAALDVLSRGFDDPLTGA